jgi:hypothetical protein
MDVGIYLPAHEGRTPTHPDMRGERDDWKTQAQRLALPNAQAARQDGQADAQPEATPAAGPWRRAWRWMRATGCLAGAGLLLVLATGAAGAQQQQQPHG